MANSKSKGVMCYRKHILVASIVLNACLVGSGIYVLKAWSLSSGISRTRTGSTLSVGAPVTKQVPSRFQWGEIESDDYRVYVANLRAIGCPEETIQDLIL